MEVNFYGPLRAVRACLPHMRARGSGNIVLISSGAGYVKYLLSVPHTARLITRRFRFIARPGRSTYSASKFAIEAIHESLTQEVDTLGIKVLIVEPGAFRTPMSSRFLFPAEHESTGGLSEAYRGTALEPMVTGVRGLTAPSDAVRGDPDKAANEIIKAIDGGHDYLRMILGVDSVQAMDRKIGQLQADLDATRVIGMNVDID